MTSDQQLIVGIALATMAMFVWGRWRHDMVATGALLACVLAGLVAPSRAFDGFAHPAVITVACVLVLSQTLQSTGAVDALARHLLPAKAGPTASIGALSVLAAVLSGFMNNVGALALLMPVALQLAGRLGIPPGKVLLPLAFGSILGGMTTLIGTPPNIVVSGFRDTAGLGSFGMFDFTPVGLAVAVCGVAFVALLGWRMVPARKAAGIEDFDTGAYLVEARVREGAKAVGLALREIETTLDEAGAQLVGLIRNDVRLMAPSAGRIVRAGDILVIEADVDMLAKALGPLELEIEGAKQHKEEHAPTASDESQEAGEDTGADAVRQDAKRNAARSDETALMELAVLPLSPLTGRSATDIGLRARYGINLLAVSRQGRRSVSRLRTMRMEAGDLLLVQGPPEAIAEFAGEHGCVPLAQRALRIPDRRKAVISTAIMLAAIGGAAFGLLPAAVAFVAGVLAAMALGVTSPRSAYDAVDWSVVVLLAMLLPVAEAMQRTGAADAIARFLIDAVGQGNAVVALALILVVTMTLSDVMNNAATAAVMCPVAIGTAAQLGASTDPFLMAVAVGSSCAFLTPIGHQNNTLILGPGGLHFGDYWRVGLPLEVIVVSVGVPMLLLVWPL